MSEKPAFIVPSDLFAAVAQYLASRPYAEVVQLLNAMSQCKPTTPEVPDATA
jgi:hypothetical protein